jgi:hypothetical protein
MVKTQELMMNRIVNLERATQQAPRVPYRGQFQKRTPVFRPKNDQEVPNTLACYHTVCSLGQRLKDRDQTGVTGTFPTQCHLNGEVLSV